MTKLNTIFTVVLVINCLLVNAEHPCCSGENEIKYLEEENETSYTEELCLDGKPLNISSCERYPLLANETQGVDEHNNLIVNEEYVLSPEEYD